MRKPSQRELLIEWEGFCESMAKATVIDRNETAIERKKRVEKLEANYEEWFKYYFPAYYTSDPAPFHIKSTKRIINNPEWYEVRPWARELSKSGRTMMEVLYLILTGKKENLIYVSATLDSAERLLLPYKKVLEINERIINDYGPQQGMKHWTSSEFITKKGGSFRALGAGQSPRGTRKDQKRPDIIVIDDIDTDEEVRNPARIREKVNWVEEALLGTRSISDALTVIVNGNIIGKYTTVTELMKKADYAKKVNIRDKNGKSTWPAKNTEEMIDRVLSKISYNSAQKEYFNNPIIEGTTFKKVNYGKCPPMKSCDEILVYSDPATSNKDKAGSSTKCVTIIGRKNLTYYLFWVRLDNCSNATFVDWLFESHRVLKDNHVDTTRVYIENNSLQDPFYEQVILKLIYKRIKRYGVTLPITPDKRRKPEKFYRIEGTLEPIHRMGNLIFNEKEKGTEHMERMNDQFIGVSPTSKTMDGPDCLEGGVWIMENRQASKNTTYVVGKRASRRY